MTIEIELKYRATGPEPLRALASTRQLGQAQLGSARTVEEVDRYLDTADGRFAAAGWACRLRSRSGSVRVSLKGPADAGTSGALHRRPEIEGPATVDLASASWPPSEARNLVDTLRGGQPLRERLRLCQRRTERAIVLEGVELGTLTLDVVEAAAGGNQFGTFHVVELEVRVAEGGNTTPAWLAGMDASLAAVAGLQPDTRTKLEHALALLEQP